MSSKCQGNQTLNRRLELLLHFLISEEGRRAGGWLNHQQSIILSIMPCNEITIKPQRKGVQTASRLGNQNASMWLHASPQTLPRQKILHLGLYSMHLSSHCWFISFNILCNTTVMYCVNKFLEFCETPKQIKQTQPFTTVQSDPLTQQKSHWHEGSNNFWPNTDWVLSYSDPGAMSRKLCLKLKSHSSIEAWAIASEKAKPVPERVPKWLVPG